MLRLQLPLTTMLDLSALLASAVMLATHAPQPRSSLLASAAGERPALSLASHRAEPQAPGMQDLQGSPGAPLPDFRTWPSRVPLLQGYLGAGLLEEIELDGGSVPTDGSDESLAQFPVVGGGAQWKLAGERVDFGFEALIGFGWRSDGTAIATGGGGALIAVDVDMLLVELYGGPFVSTFLGDHLRAYAAAGPLMQWVDYEQDGPSGTDGDGDGFGTGYYARTGLELVATESMLIGAGVRWVDSTTDMSGSLGDLELRGYQVVLTVSRF